MLIVGAKGFAKEVLEVLHQQGKADDVVFYDDVNADIPDELYGKFPVLKDLKAAEAYFSDSKDFILGVGGTAIRAKLAEKFASIGGELTSIVSPFAHIGHFGVTLETGACIMTGTIMTNDIRIGRGTLVNIDCTVGHDCVIGNFCELSPSVNVSGNCHIGDYTAIGTGAVVLPNIKIGRNVTIGAGAVVTANIEDNSVAVGIPAKVIKKLPELVF